MKIWNKSAVVLILVACSPMNDAWYWGGIDINILQQNILGQCDLIEPPGIL
jgi:hypothetical protein